MRKTRDLEKKKMTKILEIEIRRPDNTAFTTYAEPKKFKSGKIGFFGYGRINIEGRMHQMSLNFVRIEKKEKVEK